MRRIVFMLGICSCAAPRPPPPPPLPIEDAVVDGLVQVHVSPASVDPPRRYDEELSGLITALTELHLAGHPSVLPQVEGAPVSPGLAETDLADARQVRLTLRVTGGEDELQLDGECCPEGGDCLSIRATRGTREHPDPMVVEFVEQVAHCLHVEPALEAPVAAQSKDAYAVLIAGRAAATFYGLLEAPPVEKHGDKRADPFRRAVYLDPSMPLAAWMEMREALRRDQASANQIDLRVAVQKYPQPSLLADELALMLHLGETVGASSLIDRLDAAGPSDPRFALLIVRALVATGRAAEAEEHLEALPESWADHPPVAELSVASADALHLSADIVDERLQRWAKLDPDHAEPVRRRARLAIADGRFDDALLRVDELAQRGEVAEADALAVSLLAELGRWEEAAERVSSPEVRSRLLARAGDDAALLPPVAVFPRIRR